MPFFRRRRPQFFSAFAAVQRLISAENIDDVQILLEEHRDVLLSKTTLRFLKQFRDKYQHEGDAKEFRHFSMLARVVESAMRDGIFAAVLAEKTRQTQLAEAGVELLGAAPWDLEDIVRRYLPVFSLPGSIEDLRHYDMKLREENGVGEMESVIAQEGRAMKIQYAEDAVRRGVPYAEQRFKQWYQKFALEHGIQKWR